MFCHGNNCIEFVTVKICIFCLPFCRDGDSKGKELFSDFEDSSIRAEDNELTVQALGMIATGTIPDKILPEVAPTAAGKLYKDMGYS